MRYSELEFEASVVRDLVAPELDPGDRLAGVKLFERLHQYEVTIGGRHVPIDMAVAVMEGGPEAFALYDKDTDNIVVVLPERTYLALEQGHHRARFSLCHEIGHVVLHPELLKRFARLPHRQAALQRGAWSDHPVCFDTEWQANAFAAALLMPAKGLAELEERGRLNPSAISTQFQVSTDAAQRRLATYLSRKTELLASV